MEQQQLKFPGFPEKPKENYWQYPEIMNGFWHTLTPVEQKILDYILRHTWGWHKNSDYISYSQIKNGIPNLDKGTGIKNDKTIRKALKGLVKKKMIKITNIPGKLNFYSLILQANNPYQEVPIPLPRSGRTPLPRSGRHNKYTINTNNRYSSFKNLKELRNAKDIIKEKLAISKQNLAEKKYEEG